MKTAGTFHKNFTVEKWRYYLVDLLKFNFWELECHKYWGTKKDSVNRKPFSAQKLKWKIYLKNEKKEETFSFIRFLTNFFSFIHHKSSLCSSIYSLQIGKCTCNIFLVMYGLTTYQMNEDLYLQNVQDYRTFNYVLVRDDV